MNEWMDVVTSVGAFSRCSLTLIFFLHLLSRCGVLSPWFSTGGDFASWESLHNMTFGIFVVITGNGWVCY